jgi:aminoglycoside phosphotransferase family enzyme/predicted kinase
VRVAAAAAEPDRQREIVAFLRDPAAYGAGVTRVDIVETHVSLVFLAGERAYKLKRAVKLPYLDFSTPELRHRACAAELALNRRTAPSLYLELGRLARTAAGGVGFTEAGTALDWVVVMRRFDQALLFDALAQEGRLDLKSIDHLADHIAQFHAAAEPRPDHGGAAPMRAVARTNRRCLANAVRAGFTAHMAGEIWRKWSHALAADARLLEARRAAGKVRRGHGDLHLRNICLLDGAPTLFDCLEFSEALASVDILYDLAFLLMDLVHRGLANFANRVLNRYLDRTGEDDGLAAMPLFLSLRAGIRAHVTATALEHLSDEGAVAALAAESHRYLALAHQALDPSAPRLVAIGGLSGSGKSTLAAALAPEFSPFPGARVLRSDVTRKLLLGVAPETALPESAYRPEIGRLVYDALRQRAAAALGAGYSAIVDAVSLDPAERASLAAVAGAAGAAFSGLWLDAAPTAMTERIERRRGDASDATPAVLTAQLGRDPGPIDWARIDAGGGPDRTLAAARSALSRAGR